MEPVNQAQINLHLNDLLSAIQERKRQPKATFQLYLHPAQRAIATKVLQTNCRLPVECG